MQPYMSTKMHTHNAENSNETILDNYVGSGSQHMSKKEQSPMFNPNENSQWAYGMPSSSDFVQSRINPTNKMSNVKPFESIMVSPGENGYNNGMMKREQWIDKNVDELRVKNKMKASGFALYGHEGPSTSFIKEMGTPGLTEKNRVNKTFEMGQERLFTTTGIEKGQTCRPIIVDRDLSRSETLRDYTGIAGNPDTPSNEVMRGIYMPSTNQSLEPLAMTPAYAVGKHVSFEDDYGRKSSYNNPNNRSTTSSDKSYFGAIGGVIGAVISPLLDVIKPSRRDDTVINLRPYQNAKTTVSNSYLHNPSDTPEITNRQITENSKYHMNVDGKKTGAYNVVGVTEPHNAREITSDVYYGGNAQSANPKLRTYDNEYQQRNNSIKSSTIDGRLVPGNMKLMNSSLNIHINKNDNLQLNTRPVTRNVVSQTPDINTMGDVQGVRELYEGIQLERTDGRVIQEQLKGNPYNLRGML
jgi:hypothetical protein